MKNIYKTLKLMCLCAAVIFALSCFDVSAAENILSIPYKADGSAEFEIVNPVSRVEIGDSAYVKINAENLPNDLYAYELWLRFDTDFLTYKSIKNATSDVLKAEKCESGLLKVGFSGTGSESPEFKNTLASVEFTAKRSGTVSVKLESAAVLSGEMAYSEYKNIDKTAEISIAPKKTSGSFGGGGGSAGSGGSIGIIGAADSANFVAALSPTMVPVDPSRPSAKPTIFNDTYQTEWAETAIEMLYSMGIVNGYNDGGYHPNDSITRAEFSKIICEAFSIAIPSEEERDDFADITPDEWYASYVYAVKSVNFINGYEDGCFKPNDNITREEAAAIIGRALENLNIVLAAERLNVNFNDEADISDFAVGYVDKLYTMSLINGDDNNMFRPKNSLSRAETAQMIWNVLSKMNDKNSEENSENSENSENEEDTEDSPETVSYKADRKIHPEAEVKAEEENSNSDSAVETDIPETDGSESETTSEPTELPEVSEPTASPEISEPADYPDIAFECETLSGLYEYNNLYAYQIPNDGSRDAFYDDFTTYQRSADGEAYAVFEVPYAERIEVVSYFYAGEELKDFSFSTSTDGTNWSASEYTADYIIKDGKWTRAAYGISAGCVKYIRINFPETVNWWTPLISCVSAFCGEPAADSIKISGNNTLPIPRYDDSIYNFEGYVADKIGEIFDESVVFSVLDNLPQGVSLSQDGMVTVSSEALGGSEFTLICESERYGLSAEIIVTLKAPLFGDLNYDMAVDNADVDLALDMFTKTNTASDWINCRDADINGDGLINIVDIGFISKSAAVFAESEEGIKDE